MQSDYKIIMAVAATPLVLVTAVNETLARGYRLGGAPFAFSPGGGFTESMIAQAVVRDTHDTLAETLAPLLKLLPGLLPMGGIASERASDAGKDTPRVVANPDGTFTLHFDALVMPMGGIASERAPDAGEDTKSTSG